LKKISFLFLAITVISAIIAFIFIPTKSKKVNEPMAMEKAIYTLEQHEEKFMQNASELIKSKADSLIQIYSNSSDSLSKVQALSSIITYFNNIQNPELASLYVFKKAEIIKNSNSWEICGDNFINLFSDSKLDTLLIKDISNKATYSFEKSYSTDTNKLSAKLKLAQSYMELQSEPMKGVQILLSIVKKDSMNGPANLLLAKFGLVSGQYDKVEQRLKKVLYLQPNNVDALLMRAEMYSQTNRKEQAEKDLQKIIDIPGIEAPLKEQLRMAIKSLNNNKK
jgi:tetratricopeptide (TPR) repeat protein